MPSREKVHNLRSVIADGSDQAQVVIDFANQLAGAVNSSEHDMMKLALKSLEDKKIFAKDATNFTEAVLLISKVSQISRFAFLLDSVKQADFTYEITDKTIRATDFLGSDYRYKLPIKGYEPNTLEGCLSSEHKDIFINDLYKGAEKNKTAGWLKDSLHLRAQNILPAKGRVSHHRYGSRSEGIEFYREPFEKALSKLGVSAEEYFYDFDDFYKAFQSSLNLISDDGYSVNEEELSRHRKFIEGLAIDLSRIDASKHYLGLDGNLAFDATFEKYKALMVDQPRSLSSILEGYLSAYDAEEKALKSTDIYRGKIKEGHYFNIITGGAEYKYVALGEALKARVNAYLDNKIDFYKVSLSGDDAAAEELLSQVENDKRVLEPIFAAYDQLEQHMMFLDTGLSIGAEEADQCNTHSYIKEAVRLLPKIDAEIDHRMYCDLKKTGQYGDVNILAAFIAAAQIKSQDGDNALQHTGLEQINLVLRTDLMLNGWEEERPESWSDKPLPSPQDALAVDSMRYNSFSDDMERSSVDALKSHIQSEVVNRLRYIQHLGRYLNNARLHTTGRTTAKIDEILTVFANNLIPALKDIADAHEIDLKALMQVSQGNQKPKVSVQ